MRCVPNCIVPVGLVLLVCGTQGFFLPNVTHLEKLLSKYQQDEPHSRVQRAIPRSDKEEILMLHNKLRGQVYPPASNMEYMVSAGLPPRVGPGLCPPLVGVWQAWGPLARESPLCLLLTPAQRACMSSPCRGHLTASTSCHLSTAHPGTPLQALLG